MSVKIKDIEVGDIILEEGKEHLIGHLIIHYCLGKNQNVLTLKTINNKTKEIMIWKTERLASFKDRRVWIYTHYKKKNGRS